MKYLILSYNDMDHEWRFHGLKDTYQEAVEHAAKTDWPDSPMPLNFTVRGDVLNCVSSAWSGHDQWFIFLVANVRD